MDLTPTTDKKFLQTLEEWLNQQPEIFVVVSYSRVGGNKDYEFYTLFPDLVARVRCLKAETRVTAFRRPMLPLRGIVDDEFINKCLAEIRDGSEFLLVETVPTTAGAYSWFHDEAGETHAELRESLENSRGKLVVVGEYPPWWEESPDVVTAYAPDKNGVVKRGVY